MKDRSIAVTVLTRDIKDLHHDVTWLIGALARDLMARGRNPGVLEMLSKLSECDFSQASLAGVAPSRAAACTVLPEAVTGALDAAHESATALAGAHDHLRWQDVAKGTARAALLGQEAPMRARAMEVSMLLFEPGARLSLPPSGHDGLYFAMSGPSRWRTQGAALLALDAGQTLFVSAGHGLEIQAGRAPLLAACLTG